MNHLTGTSNGSQFIVVQCQTPLLLMNGVVIRANPLPLIFLFSARSHFVTARRSCAIRIQSIIYIYRALLQSRPSQTELFREVKDSSRESRLKCIESLLIGSLYLAGAKKNARRRFGLRIVGDNLQFAVSKL